MSSFNEELYKAVKSHCEPWTDLGVYIDRERLKGGDFWNEALACAICESVCMIVVFVPKYFSKEHTYCAREYKAMEKLEEMRLRALTDRNRGLIIPVVFKGPDQVPQELRRRQLYDFSKYVLVRPEISTNEEYVPMLEEIARRVYDTCKDLFENLGEDPCDGCERFNIPTEDEIRPWLEEIAGPTQRFPGR